MITYLCESALNVGAAVGDVKSQHLSGIHHQGNNTGGDENGDEERRDGVKSCPAVELDK